MSDCDCQKNIKKSESTVDDVEKPIGDGLLITTVASTTVRIFYTLRAAGVRQHNALITSKSLACFMSLHALFYQRRIDHNSHHIRNILRTKDGKFKTSKGVSDTMDIMKLAGGIVGGVFVKDYAVYKKWINERYNKKFNGPLKGNKTT